MTDTPTSSVNTNTRLVDVIDVACYWCLKPNRVFIGHAHHDAKALYRCYLCEGLSQITITQMGIKESEFFDPQIGQPIA